LLPLLAGALASVVILGMFWIAVVDDPLGGEPKAVAAIDGAKAIASSRAKENAGPATNAGPDTVGSIRADNAPTQTVTIIDGKSGARKEIAVRGGDPLEPSAPSAFDARLVEPSRHGAIPRAAADGARPLDLYARTGTAASELKGPRVAIVIGGLGIAANATADAIGKLPDTITLAFAPYGSDLSRLVARARSTGHEIVLQVPMEPSDSSGTDPGPQALLSSLTPEQNLDRLHWVLSRFQGYVGVTNFLGARFTSNEAALAPMVHDLAKRGLLYLDDGSSARSLARKLATGAKMPFLKADLALDSKPSALEIDAALQRLEKLAIAQGFAIGTGSASALSIERIAQWVKAAEARGIRIVPLSALIAKAKQS
jgi:polysaccharide deacetylase 2 family uncharacterized protein YibQ